MTSCCSNCQSAGVELGLEQRRVERQLEELMRSFGPEMRVGSADCDVNPLLLDIRRAAVCRALERAYDMINAYYAAMGATDGRDLRHNDESRERTDGQ